MPLGGNILRTFSLTSSRFTGNVALEERVSRWFLVKESTIIGVRGKMMQYHNEEKEEDGKNKDWSKFVNPKDTSFSSDLRHFSCRWEMRAAKGRWRGVVTRTRGLCACPWTWHQACILAGTISTVMLKGTLSSPCSRCSIKSKGK